MICNSGGFVHFHALAPSDKVVEQEINNSISAHIKCPGSHRSNLTQMLKRISSIFRRCCVMDKAPYFSSPTCGASSWWPTATPFASDRWFFKPNQCSNHIFGLTFNLLPNKRSYQISWLKFDPNQSSSQMSGLTFVPNQSWNQTVFAKKFRVQLFDQSKFT